MCLYCRPDTHLERLNKMINDKDRQFLFAYDTLTGIRDTIKQSGHISQRQQKAIDNIFNSKRTSK